MTQHTKGPWEVMWEDHANVIMRSIIRMEALANARLIAESPKMLEELKTVREWINQLLDFQPDEAADAITNNGEEVTQRIDDIIAKAEGRG